MTARDHIPAATVTDVRFADARTDPIGAPARVLVMLEQLAGVGYIAVVVSRLIGLGMLRLTRSNKPEPSDTP